MRVAFVGDTHGHLDFMYQLVAERETNDQAAIDHVVQLGDFGIWPHPSRCGKVELRHMAKEGLPPGGNYPEYALGHKVPPYPTLFIRGNHEDQEYLRQFERAQQFLYDTRYPTEPILLPGEFRYLPDGCVTELGGYRIAGWGGNFSYRTWKQERAYESLTGKQMRHMTQDIYARLTGGEPFDILLTHDAPSGIGLRGPEDPKDLPRDEQTGDGVPHIRTLIETKVRRYSFNGHWHCYREAQIGRSTHYALNKVDPRIDNRHSLVVLDL